MNIKPLEIITTLPDTYPPASHYQPGDVHIIADLAALKVVSDPLRQRILEAARGEPRTVKQIAAELAVSPTKLYYHMRLLEEHGLLTITSTRIVSGIIERHYQTVARRLSIDRALLGGGADTGGFDLALSLVLDEVRADLQRSIAAGLVDVTRYSPGEGGLVLGRTWRRMSRERADEFFRRLKALEEEVAAAALADDADERHEYEILIGIFPRAGAADDGSTPAQPAREP